MTKLINIGPDCEAIIMDYYYQLCFTEKFDKCMAEMKRDYTYEDKKEHNGYIWTCLSKPRGDVIYSYDKHEIEFGAVLLVERFYNSNNGEFLHKVMELDL